MFYAAFPDHYETYRPNLDGPKTPAVGAGPEGPFVANERERVPGAQLRVGNLPRSAEQGVHTADDAVLRATGPGAERFRGFVTTPRCSAPWRRRSVLAADPVRRPLLPPAGAAALPGAARAAPPARLGFEELYAAAGQRMESVPWVRLRPNPVLVEWLSRRERQGGRALVVGCSGGADSLALAAGVAHVGRERDLACAAVVVDHGLQEGSAGVARAALRRHRGGLPPRPAHPSYAEPPQARPAGPAGRPAPA